MKPEQLQELRALLTRIEAAGGPLLGREDYWIADVWDCHANVGDDFWRERDSALLIHALKLDARKRGYQYAEHPESVHLWDEVLEAAGVALEGIPIITSRHSVLTIAWCLTWLEAFESAA